MLGTEGATEYAYAGANEEKANAQASENIPNCFILLWFRKGDGDQSHQPPSILTLDYNVALVISGFPLANDPTLECPSRHRVCGGAFDVVAIRTAPFFIVLHESFRH